MEDPVAILRMLERITAVLIGGLAIYLGYRLFFHLPFEKDHEGQLELPGVKIVLSRVGPGVFFATFGTIVLFFSLTKPVNITTESGTAQPENKVSAQVENTKPAFTQRSSFIGASNAPTAQQRTKALTTIEMLNCAQRLLEEKVSRHDLEEQIAIAIRDAKQALMLSIWNEDDWGPADLFRADGLNGNVPFQVRNMLNATYGDCQK